MLAIAQDQDNELDRGATRVAPGMQRHCALTRALKPVDDMVRFVVGPGGHTVPDVKRKLPGRGIWITATRAAIDEAIKDNVFARAFKQNVRVAADLAATYWPSSMPPTRRTTASANWLRLCSTIFLKNPAKL